MKIIADIGATRGRWVLLNGKNTNIIKTEGFNPYVSEINLFDTILRSLESKIDTKKVSKIVYYGHSRTKILRYFEQWNDQICFRKNDGGFLGPSNSS